MQSSPRIGSIVSLMGVALIIIGFFLPMFTGSNPQVPGSAHPVYEWQTVSVIGSPLGLVVFSLLAALPLLGMLIVLGVSIMGLYRIHSPEIVFLKRSTAAWALAIQFLFDFFVYLISLIGYGLTVIAWGFVVVLIGFVVMLVGTLLGRLRLQTIFTPLACILLASGSVLLGLGQLTGSILILLFALPAMVLLSVLVLLIARQWVTVALTLPIVIIALYSLSFLTGFVLTGFVLPLSIRDIVFIVLLILLNGGTLWLTGRFNRLPEKPPSLS